MIHVRFEGRSYDLTEFEVGVTTGMENDEIIQRLARHLDVPVARFKDYVVDLRPTGEIVVRPEAVYG